MKNITIVSPGTLIPRLLALLCLCGWVGAQGTTRFLELARLPHPVDKEMTGSFAVGDLDGDGDQDVLVGKISGNSRTRLLIGDGRGHFIDESAKRLPLEAYPQTHAIVLGDVDGDGDLDAFVGQLGTYSKSPDRLLINDGKGYFKDLGTNNLPKSGWGSQVVTESAHFADLDGDGDLDLCFVNNGGSFGPLPIYWNDGKGKFSFIPGRVPTLSILGFGLTVGDIDGDKDVDLVYGSMLDGVRVLINDGKGKFRDDTKARLKRTGGPEALPVLVDVDGDGDQDLVVGKLWPSLDKKPAQTLLYINTGKGFFKAVTSTHMPKDDDLTTAVYARDFDLDGDPDILVVNQTVKSPGTKFYANNGMGVFKDQTAAFLPVSSKFPGGVFSDSIAAGIGDFDGDGDLDFIAGKLGLPSPKGPINDVLVWNTTRHLYAPSSQLGQYVLEVWGEPGRFAFLFVGLKQKRLAVPALGVLELDLGQALLWPGVLVLPKSRKSRWTLSLPMWMKGKRLYSQALLYDIKQPGRSHLTNAFEDLIR